MPVIHITRSHHLSHDAVRAEVEALAGELEHKLHARYHWEGDELRFSRSGASGSIRVEPGTIAVEVKLGLALAPLRGQVERTVRDYLDRRLA
jgi:putative polyhydroxyalkanoate system protein